MSSAWRAALGALFFVFALGSWLGVNCVYSELQLLMTVLPEGMALASQLSLAVQCSNVFLLLYLLFPVLCPSLLRNRETFLVLLVLAVACFGLVLLSVFWDVTASINNSPHSVALLLLTVLIGGANVCSSPVFFPIMTQYPRSFTSAFACGEASTSLVSAIVALVQDVTKFSVSVYFGIMAGLTGVAGVAYGVLRFHPLGVKLRIVARQEEEEKQTDTVVLLSETEAPRSLRAMRMAVFAAIWVDLAVTVILNIMESGALVAILSYCVLPYGESFYKAALWGGMAAAPAGTMLTLVARLGQAWQWATLWLPLCVFLIVNSSVQILPSSGAFGGFVVCCVIVARLVIGFTKALVYIRVQEKGKGDGMLLVAVAQQVGAAVGSLVFFLLVNYSNLYRQHA